MAFAGWIGVRPRAFIVDTPRAAPLVAHLLGEHYECSCATTWEHAVRRLHETRPDVILVGYHFDEMRPYRFIRHVRDDALAHHQVPIVVVRGVTLSMPFKNEDEVRLSYRDFGADEYVALDKSSSGDAFRDASANLRQVIEGLLEKHPQRRAVA